MDALTTTEGQTGLPRYFQQVFKVACTLQRGQLDFLLADGRTFRAIGRAPGPTVILNIHDPDVFARLLREGDLGFAEAYLEDGWSTPDLQGFMDLMVGGNDDVYYGFPAMGLVRRFERMRHWIRSNSRTGAKKNIAHHYDLGNRFYELWLDRTMTYSSALFQTGQESLEAAQRAKYASIVNRIGAKAGQHLLEIGCGWGGFAEYAASEHGLRVTGLTISQAQQNYATERIARAGLADRVTIKLQDYRDEIGTYDGIASIEMFEAVGEKYWPVYFNTVRARLKPGAKATLQIITIEEKRYDLYRKGVDFIQKYIFPGGMLPSPSVLKAEIGRAGLGVVGSYEFGESYSQTLRRWYETFNSHWDEVANLGFDQRFRRMWNLYLTSCASAFQFSNCDVTQITVERSVH